MIDGWAELGLFHQCTSGSRHDSFWDENRKGSSRQSCSGRSELDAVQNQWAAQHLLGSKTRSRGFSGGPKTSSTEINVSWQKQIKNRKFREETSVIRQRHAPGSEVSTLFSKIASHEFNLLYNQFLANWIFMYQDYTAIAILLMTAIPVLVVAATVFFYVRNNDRKTPLVREDFYRWFWMLPDIVTSKSIDLAFFFVSSKSFKLQT